MNLGYAIKLIRKQLGHTQNDISAMCDISQTTLSQIESGTKNPGARTIAKFCKALEIPESLVYILAMKGSDVPESKRKVYDLLFPTIKSLTLELISETEPELV